MGKGQIGLYRVVAYLDTPLVWHRGLNLDGLCVAALNEDDVHITRQTAVIPELPHTPIPWLRHHSRRVYLSSDALLPAGTRFERTYLSKRRDRDDIQRLTRPFNRGGGPDRDALKTGRIALTGLVAWQVWTKDHEWLQKLLSQRIQALGGMRRHGYGRVSEWRIAPVAGGHPDMALVDEGITLRALPIGWLQTPVMPTRLPICPPYWHSSNVEMAAPVGSKSELSNEIIRRVNEPRFTQRKGGGKGGEYADVEIEQVIPPGWIL